MRKKAFSIPDEELQLAHRRIESFCKRFSQPHLVFACHAAFPLALTPDLLYCLWANFQRDVKGNWLDIPWIAVADLMFSGLLSEVGYETYQMERVVRNLLIERLREDENFGQQRICELAQFLLAYVQPQLKSDDLKLRDFALAQRCTALAYTHPTEAVRQLAAFYRVSLESGTELVRMESLVEILAEPLAEFPPLLIYARSLGNFARGKIQLAAAQLREVPQKGNSLKVAGVSLLIPKQIQTSRSWTRRRFLQIAGWTVLAGGGFSTALILKERLQSPQSQPEVLPAPANTNLTPFDFEVPTVNLRGEVISNVSKQAKSFSHNLGNGVTLDMVAIPGGTFMMGSPPSERRSFKDERPQHQVTVPPFFMGKYPVTQAQWRAIASLPKIERDLNPNPSRFKGDRLPVESISWYEAVEFCQRLSNLIEEGYEYRLPSEAEWEYACRAQTSTPFHFGETITGQLANYNARQTYADEPQGEYRGKTTPVGQFPPNAFGLYDMHGQVWEWCADPWHENYEGAPTDGSVWSQSNNDNRYQMLRGGSWYGYPDDCRSAIRDFNSRDVILITFGFRVACGGGRT